MKNISELWNYTRYGVYKSISSRPNSIKNQNKIIFVINDKYYNTLKEYIKNKFEIKDYKIEDKFYFDINKNEYYDSISKITNNLRSIIVDKYFIDKDVFILGFSGLENYENEVIIFAKKNDIILNKNKIYWKSLEPIEVFGNFVQIEQKSLIYNL
jgi:hypothetical protein